MVLLNLWEIGERPDGSPKSLGNSRTRRHFWQALPGLLASTPGVCHICAVSKSSLGRVVDPRALDASSGARARLRVGVPAAWLAEGGELELRVPARLACARCDGGGCDGCARSGALRAPEPASARVVRAYVPRITA